MRNKTERGPLLFGVELKDAREEIFIRMVCDGLSMGVAFKRAGFSSNHNNAAFNLWHLPRIQERANAILEARRTTGVVSLNEVTDMLKRVFAGAHSEGEYSAAHNAAFSLARLYGHVTDRTSLEVIRRPSRDPDAPSEQALTSWVDSLPGPGPGLIGPPIEAVFARVASAPAAPLGQGPALDQGPGPEKPNEINWLASSEPSSIPRPEGPGPRLSNDIKGLGPATPGRPENGAPTRPVTGTPEPRARAELLGGARTEVLGPPGGSEKGAPSQGQQVPVPTRENENIPSFKDLFG